MQFTQTGPTMAERADGVTVELLADGFHVRLTSPIGEWIVEVAPAEDDDWFAVKLYPETLLRKGGEPGAKAQEQALESLIAGVRALRIRTHITDPDAEPAAAPSAQD